MSKQAPTTAPTSLDEVLFIMTHLIGLEATVTLKDDKVITGLVHAFNPSMPLSICLVNATLNNSLFSSISILQQDVVSIHVNNVSFYNFKTDKDISSSTPLSNRALEKWVDDGSVTTTDLDSNPQKWDQFKANESLFGVTTDYNDNIYTTTIDTSGDFKKRELDAQRLANEILKQQTSNPHLAEERGHVVEEMDEEEKYSSVIRSEAPKYAPPQARKNSSSAKKPIVTAAKKPEEKVLEKVVEKPIEKEKPLASEKDKSFSLPQFEDDNSAWGDDIDEPPPVVPIKNAWSKDRAMKGALASVQSSSQPNLSAQKSQAQLKPTKPPMQPTQSMQQKGSSSQLKPMQQRSSNQSVPVQPRPPVPQQQQRPPQQPYSKPSPSTSRQGSARPTSASSPSQSSTARPPPNTQAPPTQAPPSQAQPKTQPPVSMPGFQGQRPPYMIPPAIGQSQSQPIQFGQSQSAQTPPPSTGNQPAASPQSTTQPPKHVVVMNPKAAQPQHQTPLPTTSQPTQPAAPPRKYADIAKKPEVRTAPAQTNPPPVAQKLDQPQKSDDRKDSKELSKDPKDQSKLKSPIKVKSVASETMTSPLQPSEPEVPVDKAFQNFVKTERRKNKDAGETINELKKFSKEFKLKTPVPSDIQEMYSKKKTEEEGKKEFKLNPKAVEFKPNPNAAPFVPSFSIPIVPIPFFGVKKLDKKPLSIKNIYNEAFSKLTAKETSPVWPSGIPVSYMHDYPLMYYDGYEHYPPQFQYQMMQPQIYQGYPIQQQYNPMQQYQGSYYAPPGYQPGFR